MAQSISGGGLRLKECPRLRIKNLDPKKRIYRSQHGFALRPGKSISGDR